MSLGAANGVTKADPAAATVPPKSLVPPAIFDPRLAFISFIGTGIVIVPLAALKRACTRPSSSHTTVVPTDEQLPRMKNGAEPGSRGGGHWPEVGSHAPLV